MDSTTLLISIIHTHSSDRQAENVT